MAKNLLLFTALLLSLAPLSSVAASSKVKAYEKRLALRKADFNIYMLKKSRKNLREHGAIDQIKNERKGRELKRARVLKKFKRRRRVFPKQAYRKFVDQRDLRSRKLAKETVIYRKFKQKIRQVEKTRRYRIDMRKAYGLE